VPWDAAKSDGRGSGGSFERSRMEAKAAPAPATAAGMPAAPTMEDEFDKGFGGPGKKSLADSAGAEGIATSKALRKMKEEEVSNKVSEPVRQASGRTFLFRGGGWIDADALANAGKQLKVKYLSDAYFALLKARPELKAALALSDRLVISLAIVPEAGETKADAVTAFLK
jgi:Ca-activated chloride channel family protein